MNHIVSIKITKNNAEKDDDVPYIDDDDYNTKHPIHSPKDKSLHRNQNLPIITNKRCSMPTALINLNNQPTVLFQKQLTNYSLLQSHNIRITELLIKKTINNPNISKRKKIFHKFMCIGIDEKGLDSIEDMDEMSLNPKISFNYPNNEPEKDLEYNLIFLKNSCFKEAVKVKRFYVENDDDLILKIFERNFYADFKTSFCLLQPVTLEDDTKMFIFGVQFDDLFIMNTKNERKKNVFIYEKTYLFISHDPLCDLFKEIIRFILGYKKLNFYQQLEEYSSLLSKTKLRKMQLFNNEKSSESILEILQHFYDRSYPRNDEYISFQSLSSNMSMNYKHPDQNNEIFLASKYLYSSLFKFIPSKLFYSLIIRIFSEQNLLFITDNIQNLTSFVLGFYYIIQPFTWPFIIIPNLPLDLCEVVESPVPFIIGILGDKKTADQFHKNQQMKANIILFEKEKISIVNLLPLTYDEPSLKNLRQVIQTSLSKAQYSLSQKKMEDYERSCELVYKNIYSIIKKELSDVVDSIIRNNGGLMAYAQQNSIEFTTESFIRYKHSDSLSNEDNDENKDYTETEIKLFYFIQNTFITIQKEDNVEFAKAFVQTQIFAEYVDKVRNDKNREESEEDWDK